MQQTNKREIFSTVELISGLESVASLNVVGSKQQTKQQTDALRRDTPLVFVKTLCLKKSKTIQQIPQSSWSLYKNLWLLLWRVFASPGQPAPQNIYICKKQYDFSFLLNLFLVHILQSGWPLKTYKRQYIFNFCYISRVRIFKPSRPLKTCKKQYDF